MMKKNKMKNNDGKIKNCRIAENKLEKKSLEYEPK